MQQENRVHLLLLLAVFGPKVLALFTKAFKALSAGKVALAGASLASYAWLTSWQFGAVILVSLVIHEYGHLRAMRALGIPTKGMYLIPFVGGAAVAERAFQSRFEEYHVALAGPLCGLAQAVLLFAAYKVTEMPLFGALAAWVALFNCFNLLPITPLDGGRILRAITYSLNSGLAGLAFLFGILLCAALAIWLKSILLAVILLVSALEQWLQKSAWSRNCLPPLSGREILAASFEYVLITAALVYIMVACLEVPEARLALSVLRDG